ncbi:MAG: sulfatase-like hydrolase/transferase [Saprospiraceae bacterium]|nr:sulfatase-like hydrolase/transferase [Saprospiraceae bacterium]
MPTDEVTIAEALRDLGYFTAITGKWHCGEWLPEHLPMGQGFMHQYGHYAWGIDYTNFTIPHNAPARFAVYDWHRNQQPIQEQGYTTDLIANEVVRLLAGHRTENGDQPCFYYAAFNAIHGPLEDIPRYTDQLSKRQAALKCLDDAVGRIVAALDQYGFAENTFLVFANDNGGLRENMNAPYRGTKNTNYEGGVRVPCIVRWPGQIKPSTSNNQLMHITDFYRTFVSLAGGNASDRILDSYDILRVIVNEDASPRNSIIYEVEGSVRPPAMRHGDYKLIGDELYNIAEDPYEQENLASAYPTLVDSLSILLDRFAGERPPMPDVSRLMVPALPWVYGREENLNAPQWIVDHLSPIRELQPQEWRVGESPWPQAPKDGKILYTGDGR